MTLAPFVIACSAWVCWVVALPCALTMLYVRPAFLNAAARNGRSAVSQRTDDWLSGSNTATTAFACFDADAVAARTDTAATVASASTSADSFRWFLLNDLLLFS